MKKVLPIAYPLINSYSHSSNAVSIIQGSLNNNDWIFNYFIQICILDDIMLDFDDFFFLNSELLSVTSVSKTDCLKQSKTLLNYVINSINDGYYCYLIIERSCIAAYGGTTGAHDMMVYGYDEDKNVLYIADHLINSKYNFSSCTYKEFTKAVMLSAEDNNHWIFRNNLFLLKFVQAEPININLDSVMSLINSYLQGTTSELCNKRKSNPNIKRLHGLSNSYDMLIKRLRFARDQESWVPALRESMHLFYVHKKIMCLRIEYLSHYLKDNTFLILPEYLKIRDTCAICLNLYMKYMITQDERILERILVLYANMEKSESKLLYQAVNLL